MPSTVNSVRIWGYDPLIGVVPIQGIVVPGLPVLTILGLADSHARFIRDLIRPAIRSAGIQLPRGRITIHIERHCSNPESFQLAIALTILGLAGIACPSGPWVGKVSLDGQIAAPDMPGGVYTLGKISRLVQIDPSPPTAPQALCRVVGIAQKLKLPVYLDNYAGMAPVSSQVIPLPLGKCAGCQFQAVECSCSAKERLITRAKTEKAMAQHGLYYNCKGVPLTEWQAIPFVLDSIGYTTDPPEHIAQRCPMAMQSILRDATMALAALDGAKSPTTQHWAESLSYVYGEQK
jgi:hypothetical protein